MSKVTSIVLLVVGVVLLIFGLNSADSVGSEISNAVTGAPTDRSIWLIVLGVAGALAGGLGLVFGRRA